MGWTRRHETFESQDRPFVEPLYLSAIKGLDSSLLKRVELAEEEAQAAQGKGRLLGRRVQRIDQGGQGAQAVQPQGRPARPRPAAAGVVG